MWRNRLNFWLIVFTTRFLLPSAAFSTVATTVPRDYGLGVIAIRNSNSRRRVLPYAAPRRILFCSPRDDDDSSRRTRLGWAFETSPYVSPAYMCTRRDWLANTTRSAVTMAASFGVVGGVFSAKTSSAEEGEEGAAEYANPNMPAGPEERSGLVVLRVAEVAQFQEKILRAVADGDIDTVISPQQIVFGTQILLRNSNLDGNMKLMIYNEIPRRRRDEAIRNAVATMNTLQDISTTAANIVRPFETDELLRIADMYRDVRIQLNQMYEYLPEKEKAKYYGYFVAVTEYEKKVANGTYNPEIDGVLKFD